MFSRTKQLIGDNFDKLKKSSVIVFGVGGVGGYVVEMLVRSGIEKITIVDFDNVDITNINRQIIALNSTIGKPKVEAMTSRVMDINPNAQIIAINKKLLPENIESFNLAGYDYVIDCIDMVTSKIALIEYCFKNNIKIISAMGAGNRKCIPEFCVADIYSTYNDGLARVMRRELKKRDVTKHMVVFTKNIAEVSGENIGSIAYYPSMCGCVLSAYVINELIK